MKGEMITIRPDGAETTVTLAEAPGLEALQKAVGGHIESVPYFHRFHGKDGSVRPCVAFCNEEGKLDDLPPNRLAQTLWEKALGRPITEDYLVGSICIITGDDELLAAL